MSYDEIQYVSQMLSLALFGSIMLAAVVYAFRRANKSKFSNAASIPLRNDDFAPKGD